MIHTFYPHLRIQEPLLFIYFFVHLYHHYFAWFLCNRLYMLFFFFFLVATNNTSTSKPSSEGGFKVQRRSFYVRLVKKAVSRSEQRDLELVHVVGTLMMQNSTAKSNALNTDLV